MNAYFYCAISYLLLLLRHVWSSIPGVPANQRLSFHSVELIILNGLYKTVDNQCIVYK